jgi:hypothetical protein
MCGWMGIITLVLWPIAMVWAHVKPAELAAGSGQLEVARQSTIGTLQQASRRLAAIEADLSKTSGA